MAIDTATGLKIPDEAAQRAQAAEALAQLQPVAPPVATPAAPYVPEPTPTPPAEAAAQEANATPPQDDVIDRLLAAGPNSPSAPNAATAATPGATQSQGEAGTLVAPTPPQLTGDPTTDIKANQEYARQVNDYAVAAKKLHSEVEGRKAEHERIALEDNDRRIQEENDRAAAERKIKQDAVTAEVEKRTEAQKDLSRGWWATRTTPQRIGAILLGALGGIGAGFQNAAAAQLGQVGHAQNVALLTINKLMDDDYRTKKDKLEAQDKSVLEARYGLKDAAELHRVMLNDLDADRASKFRAIAAQSEAELRAKGQDIAGNEAIAAFMAEAAKSEGAILEREATRRTQEKHYAAEEALANANLGLARANLGERRSEHRDSLDEKRREFDERTTAKKAAQEDKDDKEIVREGGRPIARVTSGKGGAQAFATRDADYARAEQQLITLLEDAEKRGNRVAESDAGERGTKYHNAVIAVATVSPLGKTNEAMEAEAGSIGPSGAGIKGALLGANPDAIRRKIGEIREQRQRYRDEALTPLTPEEIQRFNKGGARVPVARKELPESEDKKADLPQTMRAGNVVWHLQADGTYK